MLSSLASVAALIGCAAILIFPGYATIRLLGVRGFAASLYAGPTLTLALVTILFSGTAWTNQLISDWATAIWLGVAALGALGLVLAVIEARRGARRLSWPLWAIAVVVPFVIMPSVFVFGPSIFANSALPDGWSYLAMADLLAHVHRLDEGGLSSLHQYASHLMAGRNATPAILAGMSLLSGLRPDQLLAPYCLFVLFANTTALAAFAATIFRRQDLSIAFVTVGAVIGPALVLHFANLDQLLILPFLPLIAAMAVRAGEGRQVAASAIVAGILTAAAFYAYIELVVIGAMVALSMAVTSSVPVRKNWPRAILFVGVTLAVAAILASPSVKALMANLLQQYQATKTFPRPGDNFLEEAWSRLSAAPWKAYLRMAVGVTGLAIAAVGLWAARARWLAVLALLCAMALTGHFAFSERYFYAAYKIATVNFWLLAFFMVAGAEAIVSRIQPRSVRYRVRVASIVLAMLVSVTTARAFDGSYMSLGRRQQSLAAVRQVAPIVGSKPTLLAIRSHEPNEWAVYYLSDAFIIINPLRIYMAQAHVAPLMHRARTPKMEQVRYIVTDANEAERVTIRGARQIWRSELYALWQVDSDDWRVQAKGGPDNDDIDIGGK